MTTTKGLQMAGNLVGENDHINKDLLRASHLARLEHRRELAEGQPEGVLNVSKLNDLADPTKSLRYATFLSIQDR
jgi:hypothetical protein